MWQPLNAYGSEQTRLHVPQTERAANTQRAYEFRTGKNPGERARRVEPAARIEVIGSRRSDVYEIDHAHRDAQALVRDALMYASVVSAAVRCGRGN